MRVELLEFSCSWSKSHSGQLSIAASNNYSLVNIIYKLVDT